MMHTSLGCDDPTLDFWKGKDGLVTGNYKIAVHDHLHASAERAAIHSSEDRLRRHTT